MSNNEFEKIKLNVGVILFNNLQVSGSGMAIEANPATHKIAEYIQRNFIPKPPATGFGEPIPGIRLMDSMLVISLTADDLKFVAEQKNGGQYHVTNAGQFLLDFKCQLENYAGSNATEKGNTEFQELIDRLIDETAAYGSDAIQLITE